MLRPKTKRFYLRIIILRLKHHWRASDIASRFGVTKPLICYALHHPELQEYIQKLTQLQPPWLWRIRDELAGSLRKMEAGKYILKSNRPKPKRRKPRFRFLRAL